MKLILVEWVDPASTGGWRDIKERIGYSKCVSAGLLIYEDDNEMELALSISDIGHKSETITIPRACVKRIRTLKCK